MNATMDNTRRDSEPNAPAPEGHYNPASSNPLPDDHAPSSSGQPADLSATGGRRTLSPEPPATRGGVRRRPRAR